ncbi:hypothetical protein [Dietzia alimentaria]|uniref:hypothetical protein n=1 Tax=Dietzia alimentaria TaxID=665550 RepID=UPI00029B142F|nr:hypothetical protein [Dietzia alimentaria]
MGIKLSTGQVAEELASLLETKSGRPTVTGEKILTLVATGLFKNIGSGKQVRVDRDDVVALASRTRYVSNPAEIAELIFRVSVIESRPDPRRDMHGRPLRSSAGVDYSTPSALGGIEGVWELSLPTANRLVAERGILLASCKGYIHPSHVREIVRWEQVEDSPRRYFRTAPASATVKKVVGSGLWIDVPPGRESDILVG